MCISGAYCHFSSGGFRSFPSIKQVYIIMTLVLSPCSLPRRRIWTLRQQLRLRKKLAQRVNVPSEGKSRWVWCRVLFSGRESCSLRIERAIQENQYLWWLHFDSSIRESGIKL